MGKAFGILFTIILGTTFVGLDYFLAAKRAGAAGYSVSDYLTERVGTAPAGIAEFVASLKPQRLEDMIPVAPEGWSVRRISNGDLAMGLGLPESASLGIEGARTATEVIMRGNTPGYRSIRRFYESEGAVAHVEIGVIPVELLGTPAHQDIVRLLRAPELAGGSRPFATARGVEFVVAPTGGAGRALLGRVGDQVEVSIFTTADDAEALLLLAGLDIAGLNGMLETPVPGLGEGDVRLLEYGEGSGGAVPAGPAMADPNMAMLMGALTTMASQSGFGSAGLPEMDQKQIEALMALQMEAMAAMAEGGQLPGLPEGMGMGDLAGLQAQVAAMQSAFAAGGGEMALPQEVMDALAAGGMGAGSLEEIAAAVGAQFEAVQGALNAASASDPVAQRPLSPAEAGPAPVVSRLTEQTCETKAGTKFCGVAAD